MAEIRVGTSGWIYRDWRERYYPAEMPTAKWFAYYCQDFDTVEINNTFYRLPEAKAFEAWRAQAPPHFLYAIKCNRYLTHNLKLTKAAEPLDRFFSRAMLLGEHLGPVLYQLPPRWKKNAARLAEFCAQLPDKVAHVVEFRELGWLDDEIYAVLRQYEVGICIHDLLPRHPKVVTGRTTYIRFHGAAGKYFGRYRRDQLRRWADWILQTAADGHDVFAYFNNDQQAAATQDAAVLRDLIAAHR
jgi:uncharacterized protein YecE (DUF72 family)